MPPFARYLVALVRGDDVVEVVFPEIANTRVTDTAERAAAAAKVPVGMQSAVTQLHTTESGLGPISTYCQTVHVAPWEGPSEEMVSLKLLERVSKPGAVFCQPAVPLLLTVLYTMHYLALLPGLFSGRGIRMRARLTASLPSALKILAAAPEIGVGADVEVSNGLGAQVDPGRARELVELAWRHSTRRVGDVTWFLR